MLKAQMSFFAILGLFLIIVTATMLMSASKLSAASLDEEAAKQAALNEDRAILEWYFDELARIAVLEAINGSSILGGEIETNAAEKVVELFNSSQFSRRGAGVLKGESANVDTSVIGNHLTADIVYAVVVQREWGRNAISSRILRIDYDIERAHRFAAKIASDIADGREITGIQEFEGARFEAEIIEDSIIIKDYSMFLKGKPIELVLQ
ncbi:hypothetical protein JXB11_02620 [Candidatus Woesearchaeota archaeon]|nr:hypothetical protein [Candidatus Woesearchaeota archaeon]